MCSKLFPGAMKSLDDKIDSRSWSTKQEVKREFILKYSNQQILTRPIPLTLLHKTLKEIYSVSTSHKNRLYQQLSKRKQSSKRLKYQFKEFKIRYRREKHIYVDAENPRQRENKQSLIQEDKLLKVKSEPFNLIKFYEQNDHAKGIFSFTKNVEDKSTNNAVHKKDISSASKQNSSRKNPNKLVNFEKTSSEKITEIFLKKVTKFEPKKVVVVNSPETINGPLPDEEEEIFLDAISLSSIGNDNINRDSFQQAPPLIRNTRDNEFDGSGGQPPDDPDDLNITTGEEDPEKTSLFLPKKLKKCEKCEIYLLHCCRYESAIDNLFSYSSALECRCGDYEKIIQMYCTRVAASQIIIKHLQEKNNQLLQKWEAIQGGTMLKVTKIM